MPAWLQDLPFGVKLALFVGLELAILGLAALVAYLRHVAPVGWGAAVLLAASLAVTGCGTCTPTAAYTIPAHWSRSYYSSESEFVGWRTHYSCSYDYSYHRRRCTPYTVPKYYYYQQYHPAEYHPDQYVPATTCKSS